MARSSEPAALRRSTLGMERLEIRAVMAFDGPGVFAEQAGVRAGFTLGVSHAFKVRWQDFQPAASARVLLEIHATVGDDEDRFAGLAVSSPAGVRQMEAADGSLLVRVGPRRCCSPMRPAANVRGGRPDPMRRPRPIASTSPPKTASASGWPGRWSSGGGPRRW
ncbi:MAG: hypothetical protein FJ275_09755 [Planctomycetes bacterium]|nr:hypothetical protein [Planctomycetota bacterium]